MTDPASRTILDPDLANASRRVVAGEFAITEWFRRIPRVTLSELAPDTAIVVCRGLGANVTALRTAVGLILCDSGSIESRQLVFDAIRGWEPERTVHSIVLTHGHFDHANGTALYDAEADARGRPRPQVIAHRNVPARFARYTQTLDWNERINARQYSRPGFQWPRSYRTPDVLVDAAMTLDIGGERFELRHGRGETDDHMWLWSAARRLVVAGDFFIWAAPNAGNPQKVQRYAGDWARTLRAMLTYRPHIVIGGHGPPLVGEDLVQTVLGDTARWLESLEAQTLTLLNGGARLDRILHAVRPPAELAARPYLQANYDDPEFVVRNIVRLYGGWWDGNPAHLKPAPEAALAAEIAALAGGAARLAERAGELVRAGELRLAGHLAEWAALAAPQDAAIHAVRSQVNTARAAAETSQMAKGIFRDAAAASAQEARSPADTHGSQAPGDADLRSR